MKSAYIVKKITYIIDRSDIKKYMKKKTSLKNLNLDNVDLNKALFEATACSAIVGICTTDEKVKSMMRRLLETDNVEFEKTGDILSAVTSSIYFDPNDNECDLIVTNYQAIRVDMNHEFEYDIPGPINYENFYNNVDMFESFEKFANIVQEGCNDVSTDKFNSLNNSTSLDFGAFFDNGNKNIPS